MILPQAPMVGFLDRLCIGHLAAVGGPVLGETKASLCQVLIFIPFIHQFRVGGGSHRVVVVVVGADAGTGMVCLLLLGTQASHEVAAGRWACIHVVLLLMVVEVVGPGSLLAPHR